jgi:hypothetical protein
MKPQKFSFNSIVLSLAMYLLCSTAPSFVLRLMRLAQMQIVVWFSVLS